MRERLSHYRQAFPFYIPPFKAFPFTPNGKAFPLHMTTRQDFPFTSDHLGFPLHKIHRPACPVPSTLHTNTHTHALTPAKEIS
eukprot:12654_4